MGLQRDDDADVSKMPRDDDADVSKVPREARRFMGSVFRSSALT